MVFRARQALTLLSLVGAALAISGCSGGGDAGGMQAPASMSGKLDTSYATGGRLAVGGHPIAIAIDRAGNVFASGQWVVKYDASGQLAPNFVDGAPATVLYDNLTIDAAGNVYTVYRDADGHLVLVKRAGGGRLVESFGQGGRVDLNSLRTFGSVRALFVDGDGNVYVDGTWIPPQTGRPIFRFIIKLDSNGRQVMSFGSGTAQGLELPEVFELQPAAAIVDSVGNAFVGYSFSAPSAVVLKVDSNGQPATGFRSDATPIPCATTLSRPPILTRDAAGNIYFGGTCRWGGEARERIFVVKFDAAGNVLAYGGGGFAADFFVARSASDPSGPGVSTQLIGLQSADDGALYVAAVASGDSCAATAIAKLGTDGSLVDAFGVHGIATTEVAFGATLAVDTFGRLYVAGGERSSCSIPSGLAVVYRLNG